MKLGKSRNLRIPGAMWLAITLAFLVVSCDFINHVLGIERNDNCEDNRSVAETLSRSQLSRDPRCLSPPNPSEVNALAQMDTQMQEGLIQDNRWNELIILLKNKASIASGVNIRAATDLRTSQRFFGYGGGVAGYNLIILDGKFLDILLDFAVYYALVEHGVVNIPVVPAADDIVIRHMSQIGPVSGVYSSVTIPDDDVLATAQYIFVNLAAAIFYHEFGHYYFEHLRSNFNHSLSDYFYPSKDEDESDFVGGALLHKAGGEIGFSTVTLDFLAFYTANKLPYYGVTSFSQITGSFQIQFSQSSPTHSSLQVRKSTFQAGFNEYGGVDYEGSLGNGSTLPQLPVEVNEAFSK